MARSIILLSLLALVVCVLQQAEGKNYTFEIVLDDPHPTKPDEYIWNSALLPSDKTYYITGYEPLVTKKIAHHLILLACTGLPDDDDELYDYDDNDEKRCIDNDPPYLYAWARGAPPLYLPPGVGFKFGKDSKVKAIRLGLHFKDLKNMTGLDMSRIGARVLYTDEPIQKEAGVFVLKSSGHIKPNETERLDITCRIKEDIKMHIFAFRTHSHQLGKVMSGYVVHSQPNNQSEWTRIGKINPLLPQFFYPTSPEVLAQKGDILTARCTMFNFKNHTVNTGQTDEDEMCNFYFMFWTDDGKFPQRPDCGSPGPPDYRWEMDPRLNNIPSDSDKLEE